MGVPSFRIYKPNHRGKIADYVAFNNPTGKRRKAMFNQISVFFKRNKYPFVFVKRR